MTSDPRRLQGVVAVMGLGIALGVLVGTEYALVTLAAAVGVAGVVASSVSAGLALGAYLLLLPLCGRVTLFQAVGFPDVTLGRVLAVWLAVVLVARTHPAAWADSQAGRLLYLTFGAFLALVLVAATRAQVLTTGLPSISTWFLLGCACSPPVGALSRLTPFEHSPDSCSPGSCGPESG
jgi:hypothetical protein